ncbi:TPA: translation initiation factor IF-2 subunit alpha [Candidatus Bathyarchaeota archaeon]|nr:translation initiation factor IF-2 subunit alpha [Candidatus Bathyarchaeota archaeon]
MSSEDYPEEGDLVVATVKRIENYGAYVTLDEYGGKEGLIHISEVASKWVRNIRDQIKEGQKLVLKVLRVDPKRGQVDLSLRRVTRREKTEKLLQWKMDKKAESILKSAAERLGGDGTKLNEVKEAILSKYESVYDALEEAVDGGEEVFVKLGIPPGWAKALAEAAKLKIRVEKAKVSATLKLTCLKPSGIDAIKKSLINAEKVKKKRGLSITAYSIGAPRYRVEVLANDYEEAESLLEKAVNEALLTIRSLGGEGRQLG